MHRDYADALCAHLCFIYAIENVSNIGTNGFYISPDTNCIIFHGATPK